MTTIYITLIIVGLLYGIPASVRIFRREMAEDENAWLVVTCGYITVFLLVYPPLGLGAIMPALQYPFHSCR